MPAEAAGKKHRGQPAATSIAGVARSHKIARLPQRELLEWHRSPDSENLGDAAAQAATGLFDFSEFDGADAEVPVGE